MKASLLRARPRLRGRMLLRVLFDPPARPSAALTMPWPAPPHIVPHASAPRLPVDATPLK
jgi:hypothetical protein